MRLEMKTSVKTNKCILMICVITFFVLLVYGIVKDYQKREFIEVEGQITHFSKVVDSGMEDKSRNTVIKYVHCKYIVDNQVYTVKYRTFFSLFLEENDDITIAYDKENPQNTSNRFENEVLLIGEVFLLLFIMFLGYSLKQAKHKNDFI